MRDRQTTGRPVRAHRFTTVLTAVVLMATTLLVATDDTATGTTGVDTADVGGGTDGDRVYTWVATRPDGGIPPVAGCDPWRPAAELSPEVGPGDLATVRLRSDGIIEILHWRACADGWQYAWIPLLDPRQLADEARHDLAEDRLARPIPITSPPSRTIVNIETWLAVVASSEVSATAAVPGLSSTVTARLDHTVFSIGSRSIAICAGAGSIWTPARAAVPPACSHVFDTTGTERLTATASWRVTWTSSIGTGGVLEPITLDGSISLTVSEIQTIGTM